MYHEGMEDQLGALGLVLNCITLWNTVYFDVRVTQRPLQTTPQTDVHGGVSYRGRTIATETPRTVGARSTAKTAPLEPDLAAMLASRHHV